MSAGAQVSPIVARFAINVIENDAHELLLLKRALHKMLGPGLWGFPAGHLEPGETAQECARRELREELGPDVRVAQVAYHGPVRDRFHGGRYEFHLYHLHWLGGEIRLNDEHTDHVWVAPEAFAAYPVMDGVDEDIWHLRIWPRRYQREDKLP